jgi:hypothetical protein
MPPKTHRLSFFKKFGLPDSTTLSIEDISALSGVPSDALYIVFNRGIGAHKTNIESVRLKKDFSKNPNMKKYPRSSRLSAEQWAMSRLYAFVDKSPKVFYGADKDVAEHYGLI